MSTPRTHRCLRTAVALAAGVAVEQARGQCQYEVTIIVQGGWSTGVGNINTPPQFVSATDYHLGSSSPCVNAGSPDTSLIPLDDFDLDEDDVTTAELTPDLDIQARVVGDIVDMGVYELPAGNGNCPGDTDDDGDVDVDDLNNVILDWGTDGSAHGGDIVGTMPGSPPDGIVNVNDLNAIIVNWGACETALELPQSVQACIQKLGADPMAVLACVAASGYWD